MLELFRKNIYLNSLMLLPYTVLLRLHTLIFPVSYQFPEAYNSYFSEWLFSQFTHPILQSVGAILIIFIQALIINHLFVYHKVSRESTLFAGLLYILFVSVNPETNYFSPLLVANTFIILALHNLLKTFKITNAGALIFNAGIFIGLASVFYTPYAILAVFGILSLLIIRSFRLREKLQYLAGILTPYYLLVVLFYWTDTNIEHLNFIKGIFFNLPSVRYPINLISVMPALILLLLIPTILINYGIISGKKNIQLQKKIDIIYWLMLFVLLSFLLFSTEDQFHLLALAVPLSLITAILMSESKRSILFELCHLAALIVAGIAQYSGY